MTGGGVEGPSQNERARPEGSIKENRPCLQDIPKQSGEEGGLQA